MRPKGETLFTNADKSYFYSRIYLYLRILENVMEAVTATGKVESLPYYVDVLMKIADSITRKKHTRKNHGNFKKFHHFFM